MRQPQTVDQLQQLVCPANCIRTSIPYFSKLIAPLQEVLEELCKKTGSHIKRSLARMPIKGSWTEQHETVFGNIKQLLSNSVSLAFPQERCTILLFTDASEYFWSVNLCQCPTSSMDKEPNDRA